MCKHTQFDCSANVIRMEDTGQFQVEVRVTCMECGKPFQWLGLEAGIDLAGARVSLDGLELRAAIAPEGARQNPIHRMLFGVQRQM